jgi:hypothetical protein
MLGICTFNGGCGIVILLWLKASFNVIGDVIGLSKGLNEMFHVVTLATDKTAEMQHNTTSLVTLSDNRDISML